MNTKTRKLNLSKFQKATHIRHTDYRKQTKVETKVEQEDIFDYLDAIETTDQLHDLLRDLA